MNVNRSGRLQGNENCWETEAYRLTGRPGEFTGQLIVFTRRRLVEDHDFGSRASDSKGVSAAKATLERLIERGMVQGVGEKSGRHYMLSPRMYKRLNE